MGSVESEQWKPPADLYIVMDYKYCKVWVRKSDKVQHYEQYPLQVSSNRQLEQCQNLFALRLQESYFPKTCYYINKGPNFLCSSSRQGSILIQRIPYRLCQFSQIPYQECISGLYYCLQGYQILHKMVGLFKVKSTMIGLDSNYRIKMWHHTDLSSAYPEDPYCYTVYEMVTSIVRSLEITGEQPKNGKRFVQYLADRKIDLFSFELAIKMVEEYATQFGIRVQNKFDYIERYLKEAEGVTPSFSNKFDIRTSQNYSVVSASSRKNKSLGKFSFRSNQIIKEDEHSNIGSTLAHKIAQDHVIEQSNTKISTIVPKSAASTVVRRQVSLNKATSPTHRIPVYSPSPEHRLIIHHQPALTTTKPDSNKQSLTSLDDYGLHVVSQPKVSQYKPSKFNQTHGHGRAASKFQSLAHDSTKQSSAIFMPGHGRAASDLPKPNNFLKSSNYRQLDNILKPDSPYYDYTETRSGEHSNSNSNGHTNSHSKSHSNSSSKSLKSADSYSFMIDEDNKQQIFNMFKNKNT